MLEWANLNPKELQSSQTLNFLTFLTDKPFRVAIFPNFEFSDILDRHTLQSCWTLQMSPEWRDSNRPTWGEELSGFVAGNEGKPRNSFSSDDMFWGCQDCVWHSEASHHMVDSFWVPLSVQLVENAEAFLCNHLLFLKSHYLHADAVRVKTLILGAPFEMKIGSVLGMVRKK